MFNCKQIFVILFFTLLQSQNEAEETTAITPSTNESKNNSDSSNKTHEVGCMVWHEFGMLKYWPVTASQKLHYRTLRRSLAKLYLRKHLELKSKIESVKNVTLENREMLKEILEILENAEGAKREG